MIRLALLSETSKAFITNYVSMKVNWTIDLEAVEHARTVLGIQQSVTVDPTWVSWWCGQLTTPVHTVLVSKLTPHHEVTPTIWHELGHALQIERDYDGDFDAHAHVLLDAYAKADVVSGKRDNAWYKRYFAIPMEREAEDIAECYSARYPLITSP